MKLYPNTSLYRETIHTLDLILGLIKPLKSSAALRMLEEGLINLSSETAIALDQADNEQMYAKLRQLSPLIAKLVQLSNLAFHLKEIDQPTNHKIETALQLLDRKVHTFPQKRRNILILSSIMGQGHMSASKAMKQGIEFLYGKDYNVSIIDFYEHVDSFFNNTFVKAYEGSTKHLPKAYQYFFESTDAKWPVKFLNIITYPLNAVKIEKLFKSYNPHVIISAFPVWDYLASMIMKKCGNIKFLSVVTDSISIHNAWVTGNPDYHIVANTETAISVKKLGVKEEKIKTLGFPVKLEFSSPTNRTEFLKDLNLNPEHFTVVLQPATEKTSATVKMIQEITSHFKDLNLIVICGRNQELLPKLEKYDHTANTRIIGWTDQMPEFLKNSDLLITKAGGATVMECIAAQKPMIITQVIPGQEMGNAELIRLHNLGIDQKSAKMTISECIEYIRKNQAHFQKNLANLSRPHASLDIAKFIHEQL